MRRDFAQPGDAGISEWDVWVKAAGGDSDDERTALLSQQVPQSLLLRH